MKIFRKRCASSFDNFKPLSLNLLDDDNRGPEVAVICARCVLQGALVARHNHYGPARRRLDKDDNSEDNNVYELEKNLHVRR